MATIIIIGHKGDKKTSPVVSVYAGDDYEAGVRAMGGAPSGVTRFSVFKNPEPWKRMTAGKGRSLAQQLDPPKPSPVAQSAPAAPPKKKLAAKKKTPQLGNL